MSRSCSLDDAIEVRVDEVEPGRGAPVPEQARLDVLQRQRLAAAAGCPADRSGRRTDSSRRASRRRAGAAPPVRAVPRTSSSPGHSARGHAGRRSAPVGCRTRLASSERQRTRPPRGTGSRLVRVLRHVGRRPAGGRLPPLPHNRHGPAAAGQSIPHIQATEAHLEALVVATSSLSTQPLASILGLLLREARPIRRPALATQS